MADVRGDGAEAARSWWRIATTSEPGSPSARSALERASDLLRLLPPEARRAIAFAREVECLRALDAAAERRFDGARDLLDAAARDLGDGAEIRFARGLVLQRAGRHVAAIDALGSALRVADGALPAPGLAAAGRRSYRAALAESLHVVGREEAARQANAAARAEAPLSFNVFTEPLERLSRSPDPGHSLSILADAARVGRDAAGAWLRAAALLTAIGRAEVAADALEKAASLGADPGALVRLRKRLG